MSSSELGDERRALLAKTAQLRELRLAKEAADKQAAEVAAAEKPVKAAGKKAVRKVRKHAAWPWEKTAPKED